MAYRKSILIANRGEIAVRIIRTLAEIGWHSVAVYSEEDSQSLHVLKADQAVLLSGHGASAYLDAAQIIAIAKAQGCDGIHPGYGFLSESAAFAEACNQAGLHFIGPDVSTLAAFGDKAKARALAAECSVPVLEGIDHEVTEAEASAFFNELPAGSAMAIKAIAGGGGRGLRVVHEQQDVTQAYQRCQSEALKAFANSAVYVERWLPRARHIEVQIVGDGKQCEHLFERECTLQRRHQKLIEVAPSPSICNEWAQQLYTAALAMANATSYRGLGTFEFLVFEQGGQTEFIFLEANPRIQVEHTVTETVLGLDLVELQLLLAFGEPLSQFALNNHTRPQRFAIQARINLESINQEGLIKGSSGTLTAWDAPSGNGVRMDSYVYSGYQTSAAFDSMVAKLIILANKPDYPFALNKVTQALREFRIHGVESNLSLLLNILSHPMVISNDIDTGFIDKHLGELLTQQTEQHVSFLPFPDDSQITTPVSTQNTTQPFTIDNNDITAPMQGSIVEVAVTVGDNLNKGAALMLLDAMKMEHVISCPTPGRVEKIYVKTGDAVQEGQPLVQFMAGDGQAAEQTDEDEIDLNQVRDDLNEVIHRHGYGLDKNRPDAVAKRRATQQRTARENIADLCDAGSFIEYGPLVIAAQRRRRSEQELMEKTPGDGMVTGLGRVNGDLFGETKSQCMVMTYDYTVLAGTQGIQNHHKKDRMFALAERLKTPVVLFSEGGGGRPGDTDSLGSSAGLDCLAFLYFARLSGLVPLVGIASGRNFAGNAALLGCCDVVIATENANIGMGGPAMIEGGGLGRYRPEDVGPASVQNHNGVIDILVANEADAVAVAKKYLAFFQGEISPWDCVDQRLLRHLIPENRLRSYDIRKVIESLFDCDSVLELRHDFGKGMITCFARIEGRPVGVVANNPQYLAGAIDSDGADKASRFMQLCDAFDIPMIFLCDTPGIMVGPDIEKTALVRHAARMFVTAANLSIPFFTVVLRKAYGLGAMTMAGGSFKAPLFAVAWPTGEFGAMGLEGAVKLGFKKELAAVTDPAEQKALFEKMVAELYERGKAVNTATFFEFDDVIDPAETRKWLLAGLAGAADSQINQPKGKKRPFVDTW